MKSFSDDPVLYAGPVWDYDIAFGNITFNAMWKEAGGVMRLNPGLDQRDEFMAAVILYYAEYFKPYLEMKAEQKIRVDAEEISASVQMDRVRWEDRNAFWNGTFDEGVEDFLTFIKERKQFLDDVWLNGKTYYRVNFVNGDTIVKTTYVEAGKSISEAVNDGFKLSEEGKHFVGWYDESLENEVDLDEEITENMAFWAKWE